MSVEFSWLLGAQAGRHQRALRRYISAHRENQKKKKEETRSSEMVDYMKEKKQKYYNRKEEKKKNKQQNKRLINHWKYEQSLLNGTRQLSVCV